MMIFALKAQESHVRLQVCSLGDMGLAGHMCSARRIFCPATLQLLQVMMYCCLRRLEHNTGRMPKASMLSPHAVW